MHNWGDEWFEKHGDELYKAIDIIYNMTRRYGRFGGQIKEKYGTLRFYAFFYAGGLYALIKPGYYYCHWPKWIWHLDCLMQARQPKWTIRLIRKWQHYIYRKAYDKAVAKFPHILTEIVICADYEQLLSPALQTERNKHWRTVE